jgi:lipopolysaccharide transport system permease protein
VIAAFGQSVFEFVIRGLLTAIAFAVYHVAPAWTVILIPIALLPLCLLTLAFGFIASLINCVTRDAGQMVTFVLTFWMFLTPVVYPAPHKGVHALINIINPISPFVNAAQDLAAVGHLTQPAYYVAGCCFSVLVFALAWRVFHLTETRIAERV